jgi:hypothetical protein
MSIEERDLPENDLKLLVESAFRKLEQTEDIDSKISLEKSNTLNWVLALTTLFVGICLQNYKSINSFYLKDILFFAEKLIFSLSVFMLITYKIINAKYETQKKSMLANLHTHKLELLFDINGKLRPRLLRDPLFIPSFINRFRDGNLIPEYDKERKVSLKKIDTSISVYAKWLRLIYSMTINAFIINLIITVVLIFNIH